MRVSSTKPLKRSDSATVVEPIISLESDSEDDQLMPFVVEPVQRLTLQQIFDQVPSPPRAELDLREMIRTNLFQYQLDSICRMMDMEDEREALPQDPNGVFSVGPISGGILCENMGTGKTLMIIGLVSATMERPARPSNGRWQVESGNPLIANDNEEPQPIKWSVRSSRDGAILFHEPVSVNGIRAIPSLLQLALCSTKYRFQSSPPVVEHIQETYTHLAVAYKSLQQYNTMDFIHHSVRSEQSRATPKNQQMQPQTTHKVHISKTTLIVLPDTLIDQWTFEFNKHVLPNTIQLKILKNSKDIIPSVLELLEFDVILISHSRLSLEDTRFGFEFKGVDRVCRCRYKGSSRIVDCKCALIQEYSGVGKKKKKTTKAGYVSPLIQIQFQRLVFDEGHLLKHENCGGDSKLLETVSKLKAHWKWVCSGTPLPNILDNGEEVDKRKRRDMEKLDLRKLGGIVCNFLKVEPLCYDKSMFAREIMNPWLSGIDTGLQRVTHLFSKLFVRHKLDEIHLEHPLPPLLEQTVFLDMNPQERININLIIAQIKLNSILSEREGKDSFGDPSQRNALHEVVSNLKLCLFHFNGTEIISHARKAHINALSGLQKTISGEKSYNINDLCAIVSHLHCAEDLFYEAHQNAEDI
ncbi:UNVERIFIED_CONTAM: hypothetical protein HDU68_012658, partial [Siphonaria sp. JEL0065]